MIKICQNSFSLTDKVKPNGDYWLMRGEVFDEIAKCDCSEKINFSHDFFENPDMSKGWVDAIESLSSIKESDFVVRLCEKVVDSVLCYDAKLAHSWLYAWTLALTSRKRWLEWSKFIEMLNYSEPSEIDKVRLRIVEKKDPVLNIKMNFQHALEMGLPVKQLPPPDENSSVFYQSMVLDILYSKNPVLNVGKKYTDCLYDSLRKEFYESGLKITVHQGMGDSVQMMKREGRKAVRWQGSNALEVSLFRGDMKEFRRIWEHTTPRAKDVVRSASSPLHCSDRTFHNLYEAMNVIYEGSPSQAALRRVVKSISKHHRYHTNQHYKSVLESNLTVTRNHYNSLGRPDPMFIDSTYGLKKLANELAPHFRGNPKIYFILGIMAGRFDIAVTGYNAATFSDEERRQNISYAIKSENLELMELLSPTEGELCSLHHVDQILFGFFLSKQSTCSELEIDEIKQFLRKIPSKKEIKKGSQRQNFCTRLLLSRLKFSDLLDVRTPFFNDMAIKGIQ